MLLFNATNWYRLFGVRYGDLPWDLINCAWNYIWLCLYMLAHDPLLQEFRLAFHILAVS
jgi:hypothetical protein